MNKYGIPIMPCTPIFTSGPVNPGRQVDRSKDEQVRINHKCLYNMFTSGPVNPRRQVDRSTGRLVRNTHNSMHSFIYLLTCQPW